MPKCCAIAFWILCLQFTSSSELVEGTLSRKLLTVTDFASRTTAKADNPSDCKDYERSEEECHYVVQQGSMVIKAGDANNCSVEGLVKLEISTHSSKQTGIHVLRQGAPGNWTFTSNERVSVLMEPVAYLAVFYSVDQAEQSDVTKVAVSNQINATVDLSHDVTVRNSKNLLWPKGTKRSCVRMGPKSDTWTTAGCKTACASAVKITCQCENATKIGVKVVVQEMKHQATIFIGLMIGFSISSALLLLTLTLLIRFRHFLKKPDRRLIVQVNMSTVLFLYHSSILVNLCFTWSFDPRWRQGVFNGLCQAAAVIQLYFELTSVIWILFEGLLIFKKVCCTHLTVSLRNTYLIAGVAWTFPLLCALGIFGLSQSGSSSIALQSEIYGIVSEKLEYRRKMNECMPTEPEMRKYCMCSHYPTDLPTKIFYGLLVGLALAFTTVILAYVGAIVWRKSRADRDATVRNHEQTTYKLSLDYCKVIATMRAVALLMAMFGTPWLVCLLIFDMNAVLAELLFVFLQGPVLFFLYCINNNDLKLAMRRIRENRTIIKKLESGRK